MDWHAAVRKVRRSLGARRDRARLGLARARRWFLRKPAFIGITGSVGKTTCKELVLAILSRHRRGSGTEENLSRIQDTARLILQTSFRDQFCVAELGIMARGDMDTLVRFVRPTIGVVTAIGTDHISAFGSREGIAEEKGRLIAALPPTGTAILNADDPLVLAMRARCAARVMTYGMNAGADVRGEILSAGWPERLKLRVSVAGSQIELQSQFCGTHWTSAILAAIATGLAMHIRLRDCVDAIAAAPAFEGRMQPVQSPGGVTFIRDDIKAGPLTIDAAFGFVREARARRKIIVVGILSDSTGSMRKHYVSVARRALAVADQVIFVGPWAARALRSVAEADRARLHVFSSVGLANDCLQQMLQPGDLVLLKGTNRKDHLGRLVLAREMDVRCWRDDCNFHHFCRYCEFLGVVSGGTAASAVPAAYDAAATVAGPRTVIVVGLGNPGQRYDRTRHNIGHAVLDRLASDAGASWTEEHGVRIARFTHAGLAVVLVRLPCLVNESGPALAKLLPRLGGRIEDCIVLFDDLDLPPGAIRIRERGSAGGHRGIVSILDTFQTDIVRRVKIGIGRPPPGVAVTDYVLRKYTPEEQAQADEATGASTARVLDLIGQIAASAGAAVNEPG